MIFLTKPTDSLFKRKYGNRAEPLETNREFVSERVDTLLPEAWQVFREHVVQEAFYNSEKRFNTCHAGRRSGKTAIAKRRLVRKALHPQRHNSLFVAAAPTVGQAKRIFWDDLKRLSAPFHRARPSESELIIPLKTGALIWVTGLDVPERIEGHSDGIEHIILDEYGNMKEAAWSQHVRPTLSDPSRLPGTADFIGVPEGRNHYYDLVEVAKITEDWAVFHWPSSDIIDAAEIEAAKRDLDELSFAQEYGGEFVSFKGAAYYCFDQNNIRPCVYNENLPLCLCLDFNVDPGVAVITQEQDVSVALDEIHIEQNSNTPRVCAEFCKRWGHHKGIVKLYGDATGGARGTAKVEGSDWDLVRSSLTNFLVEYHVPRSNPSERSRINALNSRLRSISGDRKLFVDPKCKHLIKDLEGVATKPDGSLDKSNSKLTHLSDALGYWVFAEHPTTKRTLTVEQM